MKHHTRVFWATLGLVALVVSAIPGRALDAVRQRRAPDFELSDYTGKKVTLESFRGKIVLLEFFESICPTCQDLAPQLEKLYRDYRTKGVVVVGISSDHGGAGVVARFAKKYEITFPLLLGDLEVAVRYIGVTPANPRLVIPHFFVIDRQGYVVREIQAGRDKDFDSDEPGALKHAIEDALATPAPAPSSAAQSQP